MKQVKRGQAMRCGRCGGRLIRDVDGQVCLQCGHRPLSEDDLAWIEQVRLEPPLGERAGHPRVWRTCAACGAGFATSSYRPGTYCSARCRDHARVSTR